jgi:alkylation response protein AidB-like acyl-CoA dehydrogenase
MRTLFEAEHEAFRESFAQFVAKELVPDFLQWEADGIVPRDVYRRAGEFGFLGMAIPEQYGGGGVDDFRFNQVLAEEGAAAGVTGAIAGITLHNDVCTPYFTEYCTPEQAERWLPGIAAGELITAIAMTEPGTGSDLAGIATTAIRDGDEYVVNGSKTFITNGINADLVVVVAKTDPSQRHTGMSLLVVERDMPGFERGRNLDKVGLHSQDTAELFFTDVRVPAANLLGQEGKAFAHLSHNLAQERLSIAVYGVAMARAAVRWSLDYVQERKAFGTSIGSFQNTKFVLAQCQTEVDVTQAFVDQCVTAHVAKHLSAADAAKAKLWATQVQQRVIDQCLQLFGGYGYMLEYPIARAYADARVTSIYGGTSEVMKTIIAKSMGL